MLSINKFSGEGLQVISDQFTQPSGLVLMDGYYDGKQGIGIK